MIFFPTSWSCIIFNSIFMFVFLQNLFAYGDVDGAGYNVRLQHPLGVATSPNTMSLYVADSYNHKIKVIDPSSNECSTFYPTQNNVKIHISEPGGLCLTRDGKIMYVASTNSHKIISINMQTKAANIIKLNFPEVKKPSKPFDDYKGKDLVIFPTLITMGAKKGSKLILDVDCDVIKTEKGLHLTPQAPQRWNVKFHVAKDKKTDLICDWDVAGCVRSGKEFPLHFEAALKSPNLEIEKILRIEVMLSLCEGGVCFMRRFAVDLVLGLKQDVGPVSKQTMKLTVNQDRTILIEQITK